MTEDIRFPTEEEVDKEWQEFKPANNKVAWVKDNVGRQGDVFFDGKVYWLTRIDKESGRALNVSMTPKEWEDRNKEMAERRNKEK